MGNTQASPDLIHDHLVETIVQAIGQDRPRREPLADMLIQLTSCFHADACVLWQTHQTSSGKRDIRKAQLFVLASYCKGRPLFALHNMNVRSSLTGLAIRKRSVLWTEDIHYDDRIDGVPDAIRQMQFKSMVSAPVTFLNREKGALNLYRSQPDLPFTKDDADRIAALSRIIPGLYRAIRDKMNLSLIDDLNQ